MNISLEHKPIEKNNYPMDAVCRPDKYPSIYIDRIEDQEGLSDLKIGQVVKMTGKVISIKQSEKMGSDEICYQCEVQCESMDIGGKSSKTESSYDKDREAVEKGLDEASERASKKNKFPKKQKDEDVKNKVEDEEGEEDEEE